MPLLRFIPEATNINFVGARYFAFAIDGLLLLVSIVSIAWQGFNLGIDFTGGVLMEVKAAHAVDIGPLREEINTLGFGESQLQFFGGGECDQPRQQLRPDPRPAQAGRGGQRPERGRPGGGASDQGQAGFGLLGAQDRRGGTQGEPGIVP